MSTVFTLHHLLYVSVHPQKHTVLSLVHVPSILGHVTGGGDDEVKDKMGKSLSSYGIPCLVRSGNPHLSQYIQKALFQQAFCFP